MLRTLNALPVRARHLSKQCLKGLSKHGVYVNKRGDQGKDALHGSVPVLAARLMGYFQKLWDSHK